MTSKRALDICVSLLSLVVLSPFLATGAVLTWISLGRPILYRHVRPGVGGRPFVLYKLRTMGPERDVSARPLTDSERLTAIGALLRRLSIDELPQLWNVLVGDMSLVGPRPLLTEYLPLYTPRQARRHDVAPGITGWAQVNGRNAISWEEKFELDIWYVENRSFALDLRILWMTFHKVILAKNISQPGHATSERFRGSHQ